MGEAFEVARIDALDTVPVVGGALTWRPVRRRFGIEAFGVNVFTADNEGELVIEDHSEQEGPEEALAALSRAVERNPDRVRPFAAEDDDLVSLRDDPRFQELVGA